MDSSGVTIPVQVRVNVEAEPDFKTATPLEPVLVVTVAVAEVVEAHVQVSVLTVCNKYKLKG